ncbi:hypothetical protein [Streptomyces decoyicus]|uniref:hypothetical protein n=1 Tax=Streptomyces decoyicus TaxID=249567 RepID=UPI003646F747
MGNSTLTTYIISIAASVFGAVLAVRALGHWGKGEWGKLVTFLIGAAVAGFCIYKTNQAVAILSLLGAKIASLFQT